MEGAYIQMMIWIYATLGIGGGGAIESIDPVFKTPLLCFLDWKYLTDVWYTPVARTNWIRLHQIQTATNVIAKV